MKNLLQSSLWCKFLGYKLELNKRLLLGGLWLRFSLLINDQNVTTMRTYSQSLTVIFLISKETIIYSCVPLCQSFRVFRLIIFANDVLTKTNAFILGC